MKLLSIQIGQPGPGGGSPDDASPGDQRPWITGFYKEPVAGPLGVGRTNLAGDGQADLQNHGGPDKAICIYPQDHWQAWELEFGIRLSPGAFGENLLVQGRTESEVCIGDVFRCGTAVLQVSQPRQPCWKLARRWGIKNLAARFIETGWTGWYFRVLTEGTIEAPADFELTTRRHLEWTVAAANEIMHHRKSDLEATRALAACPSLSASWRESLARRVGTRIIADSPPESV